MFHGTSTRGVCGNVCREDAYLACDCIVTYLPIATGDCVVDWCKEVVCEMCVFVITVEMPGYSVGFTKLICLLYLY